MIRVAREPDQEGWMLRPTHVLHDPGDRGRYSAPMRRLLLVSVLLGACRESPGKANVDAGPERARLDFVEGSKRAMPADIAVSGDLGRLELTAPSGTLAFDVVGKDGTQVAAEGAKVTPHPRGRATVAIDLRPLLLEAPANAAAEPGRGSLATDVHLTVTEPGTEPRKAAVHVDAGRYLNRGFRLILDDVARGTPLASASPAQAARSLVYVGADGETVQHLGKVVPLHGVDLVAHGKLGAPRKGAKCAYPRAGNPAVKDEWARVEHDLEVTVRLANDGTTLASKTFSAADVACPEDVPRGQLVVGVVPSERSVLDWLATLVTRD